MFKARGSILRGINGNVSFTVILFFYLNIHRIFFITPRSTQIVTCEFSLCFQTADNYSSCQRKLILLYITPTLQRHGSVLVNHFPEQQHVTLRCWKNGAGTSRTEILSGSALLHNASGCSVAAGVTGWHTGDSRRTTIVLYVRAWQDCCRHELQALVEMIPSEIIRLDEILSETTSPPQVNDVNSLLHVNQTSLLQEQRSYRHLIILTILCASTILGSLCFSLRFRLLIMILNRWTQNNVPTPDCTEEIPNPTTSSPIQDTDEPKDDDLRRNVTFTAYPRQQANWSNLGSCIELARLTVTRKTLQNCDFSALVPTAHDLSCTLHRRIRLTVWRCCV